MQRMYVRWAAVAVGATVASVMLSTAPVLAANAGPPHPVVRQHTSAIDSYPYKSVTVDCPADSYVFAVGGEITGGDHDVLMTGLYPGPDLRAATVVARARSVDPVPFGVTVSAICHPFTRQPSLVMETVQAGVAVDATCPDEATTLFGFGYRLEQPPGVLSGRVDAVVPDTDLSGVAVHASGAGPGSRLTAFGICYTPNLDPREPAPHRVEATTDSTSWPKFVATEPGEGSTFGVGGIVHAAGGPHLDALVALSSTVGGARASRPLAPLSLMDDEDESLTAYAIRGGTFH